MIKVVIIGPESTGKSTLTQQLADHFNCDWVPEYAREYLTTNGMDYSFDDLLTIAKGQLALEEKYTEAARSANKPFLFIDTDMYVMKVWCEFVFGKCHNWILDQVATRQYDLYLLCNTDLPWIKDDLREYPDLETRDILYKIYQDLMINQSTPWIEIGGGYDQRLQTGIDAVKKLTKRND